MNWLTTHRGVSVSLLVLLVLTAMHLISPLPWFFWAAWLAMAVYLLVTDLKPVRQ